MRHLTNPFRDGPRHFGVHEADALQGGHATETLGESTIDHVVVHVQGLECAEVSDLARQALISPEIVPCYDNESDKSRKRIGVNTMAFFVWRMFGILYLPR